MIRLVIAGATGRMGKTILQCALQDSSFQIVGALEHTKSPAVGRPLQEWVRAASSGIKISSDLDVALKGANAFIDFTHPSAIGTHAVAAAKNKVGYVLGTTGFGETERQLIEEFSKTIPIVQAPNMSIGVNLLFKLAEITSRALDENYDIEIAEIHHRLKKDSPSGTAVKLVEIMAAARKKDPKQDVISARTGEVGARPKGQIGVFSLRGGDVIGDHTVSFLGDGERIELIHKASSRDAFALGALRAAKFVATQKRGLYNMQQVLGIS